MPIEQYLDPILLVLVSTAAVNDLATRRIPNLLLLAGLVSALGLRLLSADPAASLLAALGGIGLGFAMFLPFYLLRGMAAGDVKLMAVVGAFSDASEAFEIVVLTWCVGGVMALGMVLLRGRLRLALVNIGLLLSSIRGQGAAAPAPPLQHSAGAMPYGLAIAIGTIAVLLRH